jgi:hypothetical protein
VYLIRRIELKVYRLSLQIPSQQRIKRLVYFFTSSSKQSERLDDAQKECQWFNNTTLQNISDSFTDDDSDNDDNSTSEPPMLDSGNSKELILRNIADIKTRWNSKYHS